MKFVNRYKNMRGKNQKIKRENINDSYGVVRYYSRRFIKNTCAVISIQIVIYIYIYFWALSTPSLYSYVKTVHNWVLRSWATNDIKANVLILTFDTQTDSAIIVVLVCVYRPEAKLLRRLNGVIGVTF